MNKLKDAKKVVIIFTIVVVLLTIGISIFLVFRGSITQPSIQYDPIFGMLPSPINEYTAGKFSFRIETTYEEKDIVHPVYHKDESNIFLPSRLLASRIADNLKLTKSESFGDANLYTNKERSMDVIFTKSTNSIQILYYNTLESTQSPDFDKSILNTKEFLEDIDLWPYKAQNYTTTHEFYALLGSEYFITKNDKDADRIKIAFSQEISGTNIILDRYDSGEIEVTLDGNNSIIKVNYNYNPVDMDIKGTYPLRTIKDAEEDITLNKAEVIRSYSSIPESLVKISKIDIKYLITKADQNYIQPVYVFEGKDTSENLFTFIVPAVSSNYILEPNTK